MTLTEGICLGQFLEAVAFLKPSATQIHQNTFLVDYRFLKIEQTTTITNVNKLQSFISMLHV